MKKDMPKRKQNLYGQSMGAKGEKTRAKILKATSLLMEKRSIRELTVSEIGASAGISSSTFYLYFQSVQEAALAATENIVQSSPKILRILEIDWNKDNIIENSRDFVKEYFSFWAENAAILRIRNFAADEGDRRFFDARRHSIEPIHFSLQQKIRFFQQNYENAPNLHVASTVSVLLAMLERTAAVIQLPSAHKATRAKQIESAAFLIASSMICAHNKGASNSIG